DALIVKLGSLQFACGADVDNGLGWMLSLHRIEGWDETAPDSTEAAPSSSGDGSTAGLDRLDSRQLTIPGLVLGSSGYGPGSPSAASDYIKRLRRATLHVTEADGLAREADVRVLNWQ